MATVHQNLSEYDKGKVPNGAKMKVGIVVSEWNNEITSSLLKGAMDALMEHGVLHQNICIEWVPGAFELPLGAQYLLESDQDLNGVLCLGCVIQGETKHFDFVCEGTSQGIMDTCLKYNKPVTFGVLTDNNIQQSKDRSGGKHGNKGVECAIATMKMIDLKSRIVKA